MSPRRFRPITTIQAILGSVAIAALAASVVGFSYLLLLPRGAVPSLPQPELEAPGKRNPGEIVCPSGQSLRQRPTPMPVNSAELIECPALFDGREVLYEGEAVGVVLLRPGHGWVHVNDDIYATAIGPVSEHRSVAGGNSGMAVAMPRDVAAQVTVGDYDTQGTALSIVGTYLRADPDDGGAPAIRATSVELVRPARQLDHRVSTPRIVAAVALGLAAVGLLVVRRVRSRQVD